MGGLWAMVQASWFGFILTAITLAVSAKAFDMVRSPVL